MVGMSAVKEVSIFYIEVKMIMGFIKWVIYF